jgi:hypothetical protein
MATRQNRDPAASRPASGATIMADGTPIKESPLWDAERGALLVHSDRDAGSNYDDVPVERKATRRVRQSPEAATRR